MKLETVDMHKEEEEEEWSWRADIKWLIERALDSIPNCYHDVYYMGQYIDLGY